MNYLERQAMRNAYILVTNLKNDDDTITRAELLDVLRQPLPPRSECESDAVIRHAYHLTVLNAGVQRAYQIVTYEEAATLAGKSVEAIRQAAYRKAISKSTEYWNGRERTGVFFESLAGWCKWSGQQFKEAETLLQSMRESE